MNKRALLALIVEAPVCATCIQEGRAGKPPSECCWAIHLRAIRQVIESDDEIGVAFGRPVQLRAGSPGREWVRAPRMTDGEQTWVPKDGGTFEPDDAERVAELARAHEPYESSANCEVLGCEQHARVLTLDEVRQVAGRDPDDGKPEGE